MAKYEIITVLGRGGMGVVYKAKDTILNRIVAIKVFHENLAKQDSVIKRFLRETNITAQLDHPNIVKVYSFERQAEQSLLVMECIQGKPLLDYIEEKQLSLEEKLAILIKIANALHYAHRKKILHRDIKPSNIMVRANGEPVLLDFGISKCIGMDELTRTGEFVGTIEYASPEQAEGRRREIDHRTDVYSLGAVMYHLLVGKAPFEGESFNEMLYQLECEDPIPPRQTHPEIAPAVEQICLKALAKDKEQRYASAQEFANDIQNHLSGKQTKAVRWSKQQLWKRWLGRSSLVFGILLFLAGIAFGGYYFSQKQQMVKIESHLAEQVYALQTKLEQQELWRFDPGFWEQEYQNGQQAYDFYQQNIQCIQNPQVVTNLLNYRMQCAYKLGIHQWAAEPLQSINAFSTVLGVSLPEQQQLPKTQLAAIAADMHLKYLSHHYNAVCESMPLLSKYFKRQEELFSTYPEVLFVVAKSHYHCQQYSNAQKYLQVLTSYSPFIAHPKIKGEVLYYQGMCNYYQNQYHDALQNFKAAETSWNTYGKPVDFDIYLLIYSGDCQSQLLSYSTPLNSEQFLGLDQFCQRIEPHIHKLPQRSAERALFYELKARCLLYPQDGKDPEQDKIGQALDMIAKSSQILPCRYTQYLLRGMAFRYQGRKNFIQYHQAWQEFTDASLLNPHQADSAAFILDLSTEYLNYSRDQVSDLIMQLQRWNTRMENVATDFYGIRMKQLELQCNGQLQKFVGIPYEERLIAKFYNDLHSPVSSIRQLARSSLIELVTYQDGIVSHHQTYAYLEQKLANMEEANSLRQNLVSILQEIDAQASLEAAWHHLYLLVRIPYRGSIPHPLLSECNARPGMIAFLMKILHDQHGKMIPELQSSWSWLQYLSARILVQLPYPLDAETLAALPPTANNKNVYARQILYDMITSPTQNQSLSPSFCLSIAKALKDARFLWWDRSLICQWVLAIWPQLQDNRHPEDMWLQTNIVSLLASQTDQKARSLLATIYQKTQYNLVKAFIVHELNEDEENFLSEIVMKDYYRWIPKQSPESPEMTQLRILNILNTKVICSYISYKYSKRPDTPKRAQEENAEYIKIAILLTKLLPKDANEDIKIHKAVMTVMLVTWDMDTMWHIVDEHNQTIIPAMSAMLDSEDQETRLLAMSTIPLIGNSESLRKLTQEGLNPNQLLVEKLALFYGISHGLSKNKRLLSRQNDFKDIFTIFLQLKDPRTLGWIFGILCHFRYYIEESIVDTQFRAFIIGFISTKMMENFNSSARDLLFWNLVSITRIDEFYSTIYNKISTMIHEGKFSSPMIEMLALGILLHLSMKHNLTDDYQKWAQLSSDKLNTPQFRPYLSILVWCYLQTMRNNDLNFQIHRETLAREEEIAIQDMNWLRYQKSLLDPQLHHYSELSLTTVIKVFEQFANDLTILEQEQLQQVELMLAELYYRDGKIEQANQILEKNKKHKQQLPIAILWAENNPQRIHEIWPIWNEQNKQDIQNTRQPTMFHTAMFMRMTAIQHQQENKMNQVIQDLKEASLLHSVEPESWTLLFDAMLDQQPNQAIQIIDEAHRCGFYQARTYWASVRYWAKYGKPNEQYSKIRDLLGNAASPWEYPITVQMLKDLGCNNIPSGSLCYHLAVNHAENRWHYEACLWLKEAAKLNYQTESWQIRKHSHWFKKYKTAKYKLYDVQPAIKQIFERK